MKQYLKPQFHGDQDSVIVSILNSAKQISSFMRHSPIIVLQSQNSFGDQQLHQDVVCDQIVEKHLRLNPLVKGFASQERPELHEIGQGQGYIVTYDPLDGSSVIDTNFTIGSIYTVWRTSPTKLIGQKLGNQVTSVMTLYGPRTTAIYYNSHLDKVQELTLIDHDWIVSHDHIIVKEKTKIFSPGNSRAAFDNSEYLSAINTWMTKGYTLRYSGGMVPDVCQIFIKGNGVFCAVGSKTHKAKLRALYEVAAAGFLIEKAGGKSMTAGKVSILEHVIKSFDDRLAFAVGSAEEVEFLSNLF